MNHHTTSVIFDMDGLLLDTEPISYEIYQRILAPYGYSFPISEHLRTYSGRTEEKNAAHLLETYSLPLTMQQCLDLVAKYEKEMLAKDIGLKPGAKELLNWLKENGYHIAMATSSLQERAFGMLDQHGLRPYFDCFVFGNEVPLGKPHPDIFLKACEKLGEAPARCLVAEDSEAGIQAAYTAGIPVVCVPDMREPSEPFASMAAAVLPSLQEIIGYLRSHR